MPTTIVAHPPKLILAKQPVSFTAHTTDEGAPRRIRATLSGTANADSVAVDGSANASFELSDYMQGLLTERHKTAATPVVYSNVPYHVEVEFHSLVGTPAVQTSVVGSGVYFMLDGAVPKARRKSLYATYGSLLAYLVASKSCLSWYPNTEHIKILPTQRQFLNYMQLASDTAIDLTLDLRLYFTDGTNSGLGAQFTVANVAKYSLVYFPVDYISLDIAAQAALFTDKTLAYYRVSINTGPPNMSIAVSLPYYYEPDFTWYENNRILYIKNAFGLLEIVRCTGHGEQTNEFKIEVARTDGHVLPDKISWKYDKSDMVKVNTGFLTKAQMQWLSDMDFTEAYELIGTELHPVVFNDLKLPVIHDNEYQYSAELEYEYAYNQTTEAG